MKHPGLYFKERFLDPLGITPYRLAKSIGVHQTRISQILHGKRSITPDTAVRLGAFFGVPSRWFMDLQSNYDLAQVESSAEGIERFQGRQRGEPLLEGNPTKRSARPAILPTANIS